MKQTLLTIAGVVGAVILTIVTFAFYILMAAIPIVVAILIIRWFFN